MRKCSTKSVNVDCNHTEEAISEFRPVHCAQYASVPGKSLKMMLSGDTARQKTVKSGRVASFNLQQCQNRIKEYNRMQVKYFR